METTLSIFEKQITQRLKGIHHYDAIYINEVLAKILDSYDIPKDAKLACLTIDTAMRHLDEVSKNLSSKKAILIGDLLSAHFYTLLAKLHDPIFQKQISSAIVEINEMKSSIHNGVIPREKIGHYILMIENKFPLITINRYVPNIETVNINQKLLANILENHPSYLKKYSKDELTTFLDEIKSEIY
ncbi:heptaprenyl pyrophosphate synthase subunit A [Staphylococcus cohnii]|uniref:heptaprenyl pyrophosphate synthase subunit A n=1 Tax=Staphylococcus cohnii TaxID=29382 RepID=UPI00374F9E90